MAATEPGRHTWLWYRQVAIVSHSASPTASRSPTITATPTPPLPPPQPRFTFEDGSNDGWNNTNGLHTVTECTVSNSTQVGGYNSKHALKVVINTTDPDAMPTATVSMKNGPMAGQTVFAWLRVSPMQQSSISAQFFVRDATHLWHQSPQKFVPLPGNGSWFLLSETLPPKSYSGSATLVGVQFTVPRLNTDFVVYVDDTGWM